MNVLAMLARNVLLGPVTVRFPASLPPPPSYRGLVAMNQQTCEGCGMCAFVCTSRSIVFKALKTTYEWSYEPGRCTYCGRCVDVCASHSLSHAAERPPVCTDLEALKLAYTLPRKPPPGAPSKPAPASGGAP